MTDSRTTPTRKLLTLPNPESLALSIRAKALVFNDPQSERLLEHVEQVAASDATALLIGETGTGKELVARHIHACSQRSGPFVAVNCGAFAETLIDAELFGHEAGAFTGAAGARAGWFEAANGGTLFLDEIGDLPLSLQVKLLRVLQERQVVRLGSRRPISLDVRLVAATNIDLRRAVEAQRFRSDLYYRLNVAPIQLPPLRERPGDILPLAQHFVGVYGPRIGLRDVVLAQDALLGHYWPGNIRELENVIHFALVVCRDNVVRAADLRLVSHVVLRPEATPDLPDTPAAEPAEAATRLPPVPLPAPVEAGASRELDDAIARLLGERTPALFHKIEEALVKAAYARSGDNQVQAARALGITRNTLRTLLKRHGLLSDGTPPSQRPAASEHGLSLAH